MSLLNNSRILSSPSFRQAYTYVQKTGHFDTVTGEWVDDLEETFSGSGSVQPLTGRALAQVRNRFEGGQRITEAFKIYTKDPFIAGDIVTGEKGTILFLDGKEFQVVEATRFGAHGHTKAIAVKLDEGYYDDNN